MSIPTPTFDKGYLPNAAPQPTTKRNVDGNGPDFYPTPAWATHALMLNEKFTGQIFEPACGDGAMSRVIQQYTDFGVRSSDLYPRGFGMGGVDFLQEVVPYPNIITNPPYNAAEGFVKQGFKLAERKLALLLRLSFLESVRRREEIFAVTPPTRVWVFSERITFYPKDAERAGSGTTAYAWFVWDKDPHANRTGCELRWLPVGYKRQFGDGQQEAKL